ncbi:hypothetical protein G436_0674 [Leptospira interrogans serovar Hardjo str. Norma]|uniref:Uncharacterized protein n=1 Tax=Leptospira interrogans serovar Hardjo str. Norma TaxID=1279460 RepID=A0A0M4N6B9_LEPIR|nr:hypothetical protein G436_0674 [Leptospira interrogans serovar Hardjo str. Norma]MCR8649060.1 hypothetical protein [Leptospira interrogans serovar Bataviae]OOB94275.1 hypothetical protein B0191_12875 [Leptospira interrogans serovar Hardjo]OOB98657.1 hypothetical protein B0192_09820 [Leptospira interrogans serovar Australis]
MLKNSIVEFNKTASIDSFHTTEIDGELIFQQLYYTCLFCLNFCGLRFSIFVGINILMNTIERVNFLREFSNFPLKTFRTFL